MIDIDGETLFNEETYIVIGELNYEALSNFMIDAAMTNHDDLGYYETRNVSMSRCSVAQFRYHRRFGERNRTFML